MRTAGPVDDGGLGERGTERGTYMGHVVAVELQDSEHCVDELLVHGFHRKLLGSRVLLMGSRLMFLLLHRHLRGW